MSSVFPITPHLVRILRDLGQSEQQSFERTGGLSLSSRGMDEQLTEGMADRCEAFSCILDNMYPIILVYTDIYCILIFIVSTRILMSVVYAVS